MPILSKAAAPLHLPSRGHLLDSPFSFQTMKSIWEHAYQEWRRQAHRGGQCHRHFPLEPRSEEDYHPPPSGHVKGSKGDWLRQHLLTPLKL